MSHEIKIIIPDILFLWFNKQADTEDKTLSAMGRECVKCYLEQRFGKKTIKEPPDE